MPPLQVKIVKSGPIRHNNKNAADRMAGRTLPNQNVIDSVSIFNSSRSINDSSERRKLLLNESGGPLESLGSLTLMSVSSF